MAKIEFPQSHLPKPNQIKEGDGYFIYTIGNERHIAHDLVKRARRESTQRNDRHAALSAALMWASVLFVIALLCAAWWLGLVVKNARAMDHGQYAQTDPAIREWFNSLKSGKGLCCSMADGRSITDADTDIRGNHFWVRVDGEWIEVPDEALITTPNRIGLPIVWPMRGADGKTAIRCFLPASGV